MRDAAEDFADFVAGFDSASRPDAVSEAMLDLIDTLGCAAAGRKSDGLTQLRAVIDSWSTEGEATLWFGGRTASGPDAALFNGTLAHAVEYDDTHDYATLHAGVTVIPAVLAAAERRGTLTGAELMAAIITGVEVASRLGLACDRGPGESGWLLTPLCGTFGAAAGASRALGLDPEGTLNALGIAYAQAAGNGQATIDGGLAKRMQAGLSARAGLTSAVLAAAGLTGSRNIFEGTRGYFKVYHDNAYRREALVEGLGVGAMEIGKLSYKPYPCCRWTHAAFEASMELRAAGLRPDQIAAIEVDVNRQAFMSTGQPLAQKQRPANVVAAQFSIPYVVALAIANGAVRLGDFTDSAIQRHEVLTLASKVSVTASERWSADQTRSISPARVTAKLNDGSSRHAEVTVPTGAGTDAGTPELLRRKFVDCAVYGGMANERATRQLTEIDALANTRDVVPALRRLSAAEPAEAVLA